MDIKHLRYFMEVTRTCSFTNAAENLYITQPALSRIIKSLEADVGAPLFIRSRKRLILTDAGNVLYKHAQVIEKQLQLLETELASMIAMRKGHIRIGLPTIVNSFFFSKLIASFHQEYPEVTFQLEEDGSKRIEEKIMNGKLDFGVVVLSDKNDRLDDDVGISFNHGNIRIKNIIVSKACFDGAIEGYSHISIAVNKYFSFVINNGYRL